MSRSKLSRLAAGIAIAAGLALAPPASAAEL